MSRGRTFDYTVDMDLDSGNGRTPNDIDTQAILTRLDEVADTVQAFQEQVNKQFVWLRTDIDNLRRYVKSLGQRTQTLEDDMLSRPSPMPGGLPTGTPLPAPADE